MFKQEVLLSSLPHIRNEHSKLNDIQFRENNLVVEAATLEMKTV